MIQTPKLSPTCGRFVSLLPNLSWANAKDLWNNLITKEQYHTRNPLMMSRHPNLQPRMRAILLNWLSEVSEVYQLHRETYYLAIDYFDRYLSTQTEISKQQLQLVGITSLFIAAKIEEIYPPKVGDFAYVTDGACTERQILMKELVILKSLDWNLNSMTVNSWLTIYMQLYTIFEKRERANKMIVSPIERPRLSPSKHQPPKKRKRIVTAGLQVADTNKQVIVANSNVTRQQTVSSACKESAVKSNSSDDEKQSHNTSANKTPIDSSATNSSAHKSTRTSQCKEDDEPNKSTSIRSFISSNLKSGKDEDDFMYQKFDSFFYAQIAHLVDLSMLDIGSLKFSYNMISASALYHFTNIATVMQCTGFRVDQIQECILWMTPFALAIRDEGFDTLRLQKYELIQKMPNIQAHTVDLKLLDKAQVKCQQVLADRSNNLADKSSSSSNENDSTAKPNSMSSPLKNSSTILTPPRSASKQSVDT